MFDTRAVAERARLEVVAERVRPVALAQDQTLPVLPALATLFPQGTLPRGITISVGGPGAASLALALAAAPTAAGSWSALVGLSGAGLAAAAELGVALERVAAIEAPDPAGWGTVVAALLGAFDLVLVGPSHRVPAGAVRRLTARARERGSVLVVVGGPIRAAGSAVWPEQPDLRLTTTHANWWGLGQGYGHLRARHVEVEATGRRAFVRVRRASVLLPGPAGMPEVVPAALPESGERAVAPVAEQVG